MTKIIDGKQVAQSIYREIVDEIKKIKEIDATPTLAVIVVGDNPASQIYIKKKQFIVESLGLNFKLYEFLPIATYEQIIELIEKLNEDKFTHGILVQLPLPSKYDPDKVLQKIDPGKDVDSLTKDSPHQSPSACAIMEILKSMKIKIKDKKIVVLGRGRLVGRPFSKIAKKAGCEVVTCDDKTKDIASFIKKADIIVSATGVKNLITKEMVKENQIVIDAGVSVEKGVQFGDVDFENVKEKVAAITPSKNGVGPVTIACLVRNLLSAYKKQQNS